MAIRLRRVGIECPNPDAPPRLAEGNLAVRACCGHSYSFGVLKTKGQSVVDYKEALAAKSMYY